ncbi:sulfatase family protein [Pectobacterium aroidearum]|uniref:sulfatase family protein n=1 Tax=Pectobacterium aroidearum TaxID=1201031 RepID=UPI0015DD63CE|nr:sulfatase [Pectobacterium aroidearum]MBA0204610.1 sulfatase [Pectobacterium aroidearum]
MNTFVRSAIALCCLQALSGSVLAADNTTANKAGGNAESQRPNIVYILLDDQRYDAFGFINKNIQTPHMDEIAKNGTWFKNAFVTTSLCSPSRASILTGMYVHNHGVSDNNPTDLSKLNYFPEKLKERGYQTGFFGKWHFGGADYTAKAGFAGFDRWVGLLGQGDYYPINMFGEQAKLNIDGKMVPQKGYITDELTDYAVNWLDGIDKKKPFMMYLSHKGVHSDFYPAIRHKGSMDKVTFPLPETYADTPENYEGKPMWVKNQRNSWHGVDYPYNKKMDMQQFQRDYYETLRSVDDSVGRVQEWLKKNGLDKNTIVMVMGDNGFTFGEHGLIDKRSAYETSMRVPLIASGPGFGKGDVVEDLVANIDIAPTFLEAAGAEKPKNYDGNSFLNIKSDKEKQAKRKDYFAYEYFWEYDFPYTPTTFAIRTPEYKYIQYYGIWDKEELYDMKNDPDEKQNLIDSKDKKLIETKIALRKQLYMELKDHDDRNVIPYNQRTKEGQVFRYQETGKKMADFPDEWLRGDNPRDKYSGIIPETVNKDAEGEKVFASFEKADQMVKELMNKKADK